MTKRPWPAHELAMLREIYPDVPTVDLAALLGRPVGQVYQTAARIGLKKSAAFSASVLSGRIQRGKQHPSMVASQFRPGSKPWNTGLHYVAGGRSAETRFKKGCMSGAAQHNYVPIGSQRISKDGYLERKITDDPTLYPARRWVAVHRLVWQAAHGPIPRGHVVTFRAGKRTAVEAEITVDRLECISRGELAKRNHPNSYSHELAKLVQLKGAITRQVNRITKESRA